jgi:hypothetical protein
MSPSATLTGELMKKIKVALVVGLLAWLSGCIHYVNRMIEHNRIELCQKNWNGKGELSDHMQECVSDTLSAPAPVKVDDASPLSMKSIFEKEGL